MKTIEIIRNSVMQCIERIEKLAKSVEKVDKSMKLQESQIEKGLISLSVMENFASSQFANFTYLYYEKGGEIKSILFNDGNVDNPNVPNYTISGKPVSYRCSQVTSKVVFKDFDTSAVTNMSYMFRLCSNLTTLDVSNFNTSAVTNMSYMFPNCSNLSTLDLSSFNTSAVTNMSSMFNGCSNLTTLDLSNFNTSSVTNMSYMFYRCSSLTSIIGTHTLEEVQAGTIKALRGLKVGISFSDSPNFERASILALFYGLADLTGNTAQTVTLHATAKARLTAEDIKIATDKNWNVQ